MAAFRQELAAGVTASMLDPDAIYFPEAEIMPSLAMAFMRMMFAQAEFEEHVRDLQSAIMKTPPKRPHVFARLLRLLNVDRKTGGGLGNARQRPKCMAKLIKDRPGLVTDQEKNEIVEILKAAIGPCDKRNLLAHGRWWRFDPKTSTIKMWGERKGKRQTVDHTETEILGIADELKGLALELYKVRREIERRRGDHAYRSKSFPRRVSPPGGGIPGASISTHRSRARDRAGSSVRAVPQSARRRAFQAQDQWYASDASEDRGRSARMARQRLPSRSREAQFLPAT